MTVLYINVMKIYTVKLINLLTDIATEQDPRLRISNRFPSDYFSI